MRPAVSNTFTRLLVPPVVIIVILSALLAAAAQNRISDKDLESLIRNLRDDAKSFRPVFENAIKKSTIRKTSQEKDAKALVARFAHQTDALLNHFKQTRKGDDQLNNVLSSSRQIDQLIARLRLGGQTSVSWEKIQTELQQAAGAFGVSQPTARAVDNPDTGMPSQSGQAGSAPACSVAVGAARAQKLVDECLAVSPATHPPCNAQNSCVLIIDEIKRGCSLIGRNAPQYCQEYK